MSVEYIFIFEKSTEECFSVDEILNHNEYNMLDIFIKTIILKYKYKSDDYLLTSKGIYIYILNKIKYVYMNTNNIIRIGNGTENILISLDTLKER